MAHSAAYVSIPAIPKETFLEAVNLAVGMNAKFVPPSDTAALLYTRPVVFGSSPNLGLTPPEEYIFCVYVCPGNSYHGVRPLDAVILEDFDRAAPNGTGSAKIGGNYAPVIRHGLGAMKQGYPVTLHLDSKTRSEIDEFSTSGFLGVKSQQGQTLLVVPDSKNIINSVTSDCCLRLGESLGWKIEKRSVGGFVLLSYGMLIPSTRSNTRNSPSSQRS
jgi:branched-chain amino acid aminotransferase